MATQLLTASLLLLATSPVTNGGIDDTKGLSATEDVWIRTAQVNSQDRETELPRAGFAAPVIPEPQRSDKNGQLALPGSAKEAADEPPRLKAPDLAPFPVARNTDTRETVVWALRQAPAVDTAELLTEWIAAEREGAGSKPTTVVPVAISNSLLITAPSKQLQSLRQIIEQLDRPALQIRVKAVLLEAVAGVSATDEKLPAGNMQDILAAFKQRGELRIIAQPELLAVDNIPATLHLGNRTPRVTATTTAGRGRANQVSMENVGTILKVTCRTTESEQMTIDIDLESSNVGREDDGTIIAEMADGQTIRAPAIETVSLQTTVSVHSGRTILLCGMVVHSAERPTHMMLLLQAEIVQ